MNEYEQRQQARRERLLAHAAALEAASDANYRRARALADCIPLGQPILVGHHSERRHRRHLAKIDARYQASFQAAKDAADARRRAASVGTAGISSDDPDAIEKIQERIAHLEERQARMKLINAAHRKFKSGKDNWHKGLTGDEVTAVTNYKPAYSWEPHPYAPYQFQNLGNNIRRLRERVKHLQERAVEAEAQPTAATECGGFSVIENREANRVQVRFPGKPAAAVRDILKRNGFRWSPTEGAWQRMLNGHALWALTASDGYLRRELEAALPVRVPS